jgi:hypothetical protein
MRLPANPAGSFEPDRVCRFDAKEFPTVGGSAEGTIRQQADPLYGRQSECGAQF